jgi:hypothetical protein
VTTPVTLTPAPLKLVAVTTPVTLRPSAVTPAAFNSVVDGIPTLPDKVKVPSLELIVSVCPFI